MKFLFALMTLALVTSGCASKKKNAEQEVDEKVAQSKVHDSQELGGTIHHAIDASTISAAKKEELNNILTMNKAKAQALTEKSYQLRAVLIEELLSGKISQKRVSILKKDIRKVEEDRLKNTFDTVEKISAIVADHPDKQKFTEHLINIDRAR